MYLLYYGGGSEGCIDCIVVKGVRDIYFVMVAEVKDVYNVLLWSELGKYLMYFD